MKKILLSNLFLLIIGSLYSQDTVNQKLPIYKISTPDRSFTEGYISTFSDSVIYISSTPVRFNLNGYSKTGDKAIDYKSLNQIYIRRKGTTGRTILSASLIGIGTGVIFGLIDGDDYKRNSGSSWCLFCMTAGEKATLLGITGGFTGAATGAIIGALKHKTFKIGQDKQKFNNMRNTIVRRFSKATDL
ncbi:MAG TPA: hypothetical protein VF622_14105 [Segetibacter sp.]